MIWCEAAENANTSHPYTPAALLSHYGCNYSHFFFITNRNLWSWVFTHRLCMFLRVNRASKFTRRHRVPYIGSPVLDILRANIGFERILFYSIRNSNSVQCYVVKGCLSPRSLYANKNICSLGRLPSSNSQINLSRSPSAPSIRCAKYVKKNSANTTFMGAFFSSSFLCAILVFNIYFFSRLRTIERHKKSHFYRAFISNSVVFFMRAHFSSKQRCREKNIYSKQIFPNELMGSSIDTLFAVATKLTQKYN